MGTGRRSALWAASLGYRLIVGIRNKLYDRGLLKSHRASVPVLCVGNLTTGGTGKTPLVAWLARFVAEKGLRPAILTRGYKAITPQERWAVPTLRPMSRRSWRRVARAFR